MKAEGLQHLFVALVGSDCKELWTLLVSFFGKGTGFDPLDFLDAALAIKPPLDLGDTDSDKAEGRSDAASSVTLGSTSTVSTATVPTPAATASTSQASTTISHKALAMSEDPVTTETSHPVLKSKPTWPDRVPTIDLAEACVPTSLANIHHTSIPSGVSCKCSEKTTSRGASLYICPHKDCGSTPYVGDLQGCGSHLCRVHYGTCLVCPFYPNQCYYPVGGWKSHMSAKHAQVVWFGTPEATQASLMLSAMQEEVTTPAPDPTPALPEVEVKVSTDPTPPTPDTMEDTGEVLSELTPEQEQEFLAGEESSQNTPRPPTPDDRTLLKATSFTPSDLRQWEYSSSVCSSIMSHRPKGGDLSKDLAIAMVKEDIPPED